MTKKFKIDEMTLVLIVAFLAIIVGISQHNEPAQIEAEKITNMILDEHDISFANNGIIDENKLKQIQRMNYNDFKKYLNAKNDFCIYIEDENGNIILANGDAELSQDEVCVE